MSRSVSIESLGGSIPVQGEGTVADGRHFYFRARYTMWQMSLGATADEAVEGTSWMWSEPWGDSPFAAGYMDEETARAIVESCAEMIAAGVEPPVAFAGASEDELAARQLAGLIVEDICTYQLEEIMEAGSRARDAMTSHIGEGRAMFHGRVAPQHHSIYEAALVQIDARATGETVHDTWIVDVDSARSVGRRWAAMLERLPPEGRTQASEDVHRWLATWTPSGPVRDAALAELAAKR